MFERNDKYLLWVRIIYNVVLIICAVAFVVAGIILAMAEPLYLLLSFGGLFVCWLGWVFISLYLSYLCDIKLIRNKLYGQSNDNLSVFLAKKEGAPRAGSAGGDRANKTEQLLRLKKLLDDGTITQEEFEREKQRLLK